MNIPTLCRRGSRSVDGEGGGDELCSEMTDLKMHSLKKKKKRKTREGVEGRRSSVTAMGCSQ